MAELKYILYFLTMQCLVYVYTCIENVCTIKFRPRCFDSNIKRINNESFSYLNVVFSSGGSSNIKGATLAGKAQKTIFRLNKYL